jgi:hypothetical protein
VRLFSTTCQYNTRQYSCMLPSPCAGLEAQTGPACGPVSLARMGAARWQRLS